MTNKRIKQMTPAVARLDSPRNPTRQQRIRQHRQAKAWRKAQEAKKR